VNAYFHDFDWLIWCRRFSSSQSVSSPSIRSNMFPRSSGIPFNRQKTGHAWPPVDLGLPAFLRWCSLSRAFRYYEGLAVIFYGIGG